MTSRRAQPDRERRRELAARRCVIALTAAFPGLVVQYLLGMYINLYVPHPHSQAVVVVHFAVGAALLATAIVATASAVMSHRRRHLVVSMIGLIALAIAGAGGIRFLNAGHHSGDSYVMAVGFILATATYGAGLRSIDQAAAPATAQPPSGQAAASRASTR